MDDIPSLSNRPVGSRFITQDEVESARSRREEQWKAAYARLGQEPPPPQQEDSYDGRSLAEKLAANKIAKQEEWEEKTKLANQFRALEEDEIMFLDSVREKQEAEERERRQKDGEEVKSFKQAVAARTLPSNPLPAPTATKVPPSKPTAVKKDKKPLKGVVVKRKAKPPNADTKLETVENKDGTDKQAATSKVVDERQQDDAPVSKRRKISEP